jgi:imidazolonepropionase-like amidohydrolase
MLDELKRIQTHNPQVALAEMLTWITSNGARALQMEDKLGSIEIGKKPGLVLIENLSEIGQLQTASISNKII